MAYLELRGGRERAFDFATANGVAEASRAIHVPRAQRPVPLGSRVSKEERDAHAAFVSDLGEAAIWKKYV